MATVDHREELGQDRGQGAGTAGRGMVVPRVFSTEGVSPFDQVEWDERTAAIKDERGKVIFEQTVMWNPQSVSNVAVFAGWQPFGFEFRRSQTGKLRAQRRDAV